MTNDELGRDQTDWNGQVKPPMERKGQISRRVNRALIDLKGSLPSATSILVILILFPLEITIVVQEEAVAAEDPLAIRSRRVRDSEHVQAKSEKPT